MDYSIHNEILHRDKLCFTGRCRLKSVFQEADRHFVRRSFFINERSLK